MKKHSTKLKNMLDHGEREMLVSIDRMVELFRKKKADQDSMNGEGEGALAFSRHFLIFSYNYFSLGLEERARAMLREISPEYFRRQLVGEMEESVQAVNLAQYWERRREPERAALHRAQAEFFLVASGILPYLMKEKDLVGQAYFQDFLDQLKHKTFIIKMIPDLKIVHPSLSNQEKNEDEIDERGTF